jgi:hypothetical protein
MVNKSIGLSFAAAVCSGLVLSAQAPAPATQPQRPQPPTVASTQQAATTIVGCVYEEKDVPGRSPNIAEKAGVLEDYILAEIRPSAPTATPGAAATSGGSQLGTMYKLEHADDSKLKAVVGKRVEVTGRIDREAGDSAAPPAAVPNPSQADKAIGRDKIDLAEFEVASIKEVPGACPASAKAP